MAKILFDAGANVDIRDQRQGQIALEFAALDDAVVTVWLLLRQGADPNAPDRYGAKGAPLRAAASIGNHVIVRELLDNGATLNLAGGSHGTALQTALAHGHDQIATMLLAQGADVNAIGGYYGTALQAASHSNNIDIVRMLLARGADPGVRAGRFGTAF